ncbi:MAG: ATP-dependent helicase [Candidatus Aminicenantes bacterium]|nr:ATP-dependent helicase [Candidatus Aminicenantes bacterium]
MSVKLSPKQEQIVKDTEGALLVIATAGSGKIRVLTERVRYLLENKKGHYKVLALTFTNKAAEEMKNRLADIPNLNEKTFIGTIHSFCLEVVKYQGSTIGLKEMPHIFESEADRVKILREVFESNNHLKQFFLDAPDKQKYLHECLNFISSQKRKLVIPQYDNGWHTQELQFILYQEYQKLLTAQNAVDFDDILVLAHKIFVERPKVAELYRNIYRYICIDEAQDLNYAQYGIIKAMCGDIHRNVLMVGDPNQAIYGFNGSDKKYMCESFKKHFNAEVIRLDENYRSSKAVIRRANRLNPRAIDEKTAKIEGETQVLSFEDEEAEASWIVGKIKSLLQSKNHPDIEGEISLEKMAVLARNKYVFKALENTLEENPSIYYFYKKTNELSKSESDIMKIFDLGTRIIVNPLDEIHFSLICEVIGIDPQQDVPYKKGIEKLECLKQKIKDPLIREQFDVILEAWQILDRDETKFEQALETINAYVQVEFNDEEDVPQKALISSDIEEWKNLWNKYKQQFLPEYRSLKHFRSVIAMGTLQVIKNIRGLTLGTVHSVKGLEYDIVFLMGMTEGTFPDYRAIKSGASAAALQEEKNNAFVAVTRSKRLLYITYPLKKLMPWGDYQDQKISRFLEL